ncbi:MAG: YCF48-related protein [Ignavibacteriaceae bacterium]
MFLFFHSAVNAQQYYSWAVGNTGKILKTTNGGTNWTTQSSGTTNDLYSVYFVNETTGWAVGWSGKILKSINGSTN